MTCAKCGADNGEGVQFCTNCHATLIFKCPKCEHAQSHGGICEACGLDLETFWQHQLAIKRVQEGTVERRQVARELDAVENAGLWSWSIFLVTAAYERISAWWQSR